MWFLLACGPVSPVVTFPEKSVRPLEDVPEDTAYTEPTDPYEGADDWIFDQTIIHRIDLTLGSQKKLDLNGDPYTSVSADFAYDGVAVPGVGVRLRGKIGSYRDTNGKPKWAIDFNKFSPKQRFFGLESLSLNNEVVDCSYLKEPMGYWMFEVGGVPSLRTAFAEVYVDDLDYGLYVVVETPDDRYLAHTFEDPKGNLYDGKYVWYGDYNYTLLDFSSSVDSLFQLEEGTDIGKTDIYAVTAAVEASYGTDRFYEEVGNVLNWDEYLKNLAVEQLIGHLDGYALNTNNYRIYFDPADGKAQMLPWDLDYAFGVDSWWGMDWHSPRGLLASGCFRDPTCKQKEKEAVAALLDAFDPDEFAEKYAAFRSLTEDAAFSDPRRECSSRDITPSHEFMLSWAQSRPAELRAFWGL